MKSESTLKYFFIIVLLISAILFASSYQTNEIVSATSLSSETQSENISTQQTGISSLLLTDWLPLGSGLNDVVNAIAVSGSDIYVGGKFLNAGGIEAADRIARWDGYNWHALGNGLNMTVRSIVVSGSDIYVGGAFSNAGGIASADKIARWDGATWHALGTGINESADGVYSMAVSGSDLYVGGAFGDAGGNIDADYIARWDGSNWHALQSLYHELGATVVHAIAISGSDLYAGGNFTNASGVADADYIARWDGISWHALGTGINTYPSSVRAIAADGSDIYVGGTFLDAGDNPDADKFARWDGTTWHVVGVSSPLYQVYAIAVDGTDIYIGGDSTGNGFKKWDGVNWSILGSGLTSYPTVNAVAYDDNYIYAGGSFTDAGGDPSGDAIARYPKGDIPINHYIYLPSVIKGE
jgi:hypothetical protein